MHLTLRSLRFLRLRVRHEWLCDRTEIVSPSKFQVSRQGLTLPIDWSSLPTIPAVQALPKLERGSSTLIVRAIAAVDPKPIAPYSKHLFTSF